MANEFSYHYMCVIMVSQGPVSCNLSHRVPGNALIRKVAKTKFEVNSSY